MEKKVQVEFERLLGIQVLKLEDGRALLKLPFRRRFTNPHGSLHGGAIAALADTAAANALLVRYAGRSFLTVKFNREKAEVAAAAAEFFVREKR